MTISHIRNPYLRRSVLVVTSVPLVMLAVVLGALRGALEEVEDLLPLFPRAWRGK